ncbi:MAG TPA: hypothetical protein VFY63_13480 [Pseudorhizobium sp.]|nr:hypothetical protein [Pseudorhizobium sp.]
MTNEMSGRDEPDRYIRQRRRDRNCVPFGFDAAGTKAATRVISNMSLSLSVALLFVIPNHAARSILGDEARISNGFQHMWDIFLTDDKIQAEM